MFIRTSDVHPAVYQWLNENSMYPENIVAMDDIYHCIFDDSTVEIMIENQHIKKLRFIPKHNTHGDYDVY